MEEAELEALFTEITGKPFPKDLVVNDPFPAVCADPAHALGCGAAPEQFFDFSEFTEPAADAMDAPLDAAYDAAGDALHGLLHEHPMRRMIRICETYDTEPLRWSRNRDNTISMVDKDARKQPYPVKIGRSGKIPATERFPGLPNVLVATNVLPLGRQIFKEDYNTVKRFLASAGIRNLSNVRELRLEITSQNTNSPREIINAMRSGRPLEVGSIGGSYEYPADRLTVDAIWGWMIDRGRYTHTLCHELGHRFHFGAWGLDRVPNETVKQKQQTRPFDRHVKAMWVEAQSNSALVVTPYALTTYREFWAEVFGLYVQGRLNHRPALKRWAKGVIDTFKRSNIYC